MADLVTGKRRVTRFAAAVYEQLVAYKRANGGASPPLEVLAGRCGMRAKSNVHYHLATLEAAGWVERRGRHHIAIPGERWLAPGEEQGAR